MCSPSWFHQRHGSDQTYDLRVYKNDDEYFDDLGQAYRAEIKELYYLGCRHIQIDDPTFCYFCNDSMIVQMEAAGVDHEALLDTYIRAINICTAERPNDLTISVHMCRGNFRGGLHFTEGSYARIAAKLFRNLDVDTFYVRDWRLPLHLSLTSCHIIKLTYIVTARIRYTTRWRFLTFETSSPGQSCRPWPRDNKEC